MSGDEIEPEWINGFLTVDVYYNDASLHSYEDFAMTKERKYGMSSRIDNVERPER